MPETVRKAVVQALFKYGGLSNCDANSTICKFHMKVAIRHIVRDRSQKLIVVLIKEALCSHAGLTPVECREWFNASPL